MAVGTGLYVISIFTTILILFVLVGIEQWEHVLHNGAESRIVQVRIAEIIPSDSEYRRMLEKHHIHLSTTYLEYDYKQGTTVLNLAVIAKETADFMALFEDMRHLYPTDSITLSNQLK